MVDHITVGTFSGGTNQGPKEKIQVKVRYERTVVIIAHRTIGRKCSA